MKSYKSAIKTTVLIRPVFVVLIVRMNLFAFV